MLRFLDAGLDSREGRSWQSKLLRSSFVQLLEGEWLHNRVQFEALRTRLIGRYVAEDLEEHKSCRYLLNDIIRYWRTVCVDFEQRTATGDKARAIQLIKLRFARMMLYFGGVAAISRTGGIPAAEKKQELAALFARHPIERLQAVFGEQEMRLALTACAKFLNALDDPSIRTALDSSGHTGLGIDGYRELVEVAREFREGLEGLLVDSSGPRNRVASVLLP